MLFRIFLLAVTLYVPACNRGHHISDIGPSDADVPDRGGVGRPDIGADSGAKDVGHHDASLDASSGDIGWFDAPNTWRPKVFDPPVPTFLVSEGVVSEMHFPDLSWEPCGPACEAASLDYGDFTGADTFSVARDTDGNAAYVHAQHAFNAQRMVAFDRIIKLSTGKTVGALRMDPPSPGEQFRGIFITRRKESAMAFHLADYSQNDARIYVSFDAVSQTWDFKQPWSAADSYRDSWCELFDLDLSPPDIYFACMDALWVMEEAGSGKLTQIADSNYARNGAGNFGLAVWAEATSSRTYTRLRARSESGEIRTLADLPGAACWLSVGQSRVVGIRSPNMLSCGGNPVDPRLFYISRTDGSLAESPIFASTADQLYIYSVSTWGDYAAVQTGRRAPDTGKPEVITLLIRLPDWSIRLIRTPAGFDRAYSTAVVDGEYLYYNVNKTNPNQVLERIYRHRLDQFDEIGVPYQYPAATVP